MPEKTAISPAHYDRLIKMNDSINSVNQMMQMFQANAQAKLQQYQVEARKIWEDILKEQPDLDLVNINWEPGKEANTIVPTQMRIPQ